MKTSGKVKNKILEDYKVNGNKTLTGLINGVSARTVGRIVHEAYEASQVKLTGEYRDEVEAALKVIVEKPTPDVEEPTLEDIQFMISRQSVIVCLGTEKHVITSSHMNFDKVCSKLLEEDFEGVLNLMDITKAITDLCHGDIQVTSGEMFYKGFRIDNSISRHVLEQLKEGIKPINVLNFMENLMQNPSYRATQELWGFLKKQQMPITDDGYFLAYKKVKGDYTDCFTGKIDNSVGQIPYMPRNLVDEDKDRTCSMGLHFCSVSYLNHYPGDRIMVVKVNPRDVVAIPADYNNAKGRCSVYEVIGELRDKNQPLSDFISNP